MKNTLLVFFFGILLGCSATDTTPPHAATGAPTNILQQHSNSVKDTIIQPPVSNGTVETMDDEAIKYQGIYEQYFSVKEFEQSFGTADSMQAVSDDAPCNDGNFWYRLDGSLDKDALDKISQYWYKNGSCFERYADSIAVQNFKLQGGHFITYKGIRLDEHSTLEDFKKLFPYAAKAIGDMDVYAEGTLQVFYIKEDAAGISDGHIKLFFKNNKFYMIHHWFPC